MQKFHFENSLALVPPLGLLQRYKWPIGIVGTCAVFGACGYYCRAKLVSCYLSFTFGVPIRIKQLHLGKGFIKLSNVQVVSPSTTNKIGPDALFIPELKLDIRQSESSIRYIDVSVQRTQVNLIFQNISMTENNWRKLAKLSRERGHLVYRKDRSNTNRRIKLGKILLEKGAVLSVRSDVLQQKLIEDIQLQETYLDTEEFSSFDAFTSFLERLSAKNILEGNVLRISQPTKQALIDYANDVWRKRVQHTKDKVTHHLKEWEDKLEISEQTWKNEIEQYSKTMEKLKQKGLSALQNTRQLLQQEQK
eukprot:jgi/Galph1/2172/GphlegSOOS_G851.1